MISKKRHPPAELQIELSAIAFHAACDIGSIVGDNLPAEKLAEIQVVVAKAMCGAVFAMKPAPLVS